jgi:hypothetical protein
MDDTTATDRVRQSLLAISMIAAPVLIFVGGALATHASDKSSPAAVAQFVASRGQHIAAGMIAAAGFTLLIPAMIGLMQFARARGAALATAGGILGWIGASGLAVNNYLITVVTGVLTTHSSDYGIAAQANHIARHSTLAHAGFFLGIALSLGIVLAAVGTIRAKSLPLWLSILFIVGAVLVAGPSGPFLGIVISVSFIIGGVLLWQRAHAGAPIDVPAATTRGQTAAPASAS